MSSFTSLLTIDIDAGSADRAPKMDFEGKRRPRGGKVDIGAYEFSPTTGQLWVHPANSRYFTNGTKGIYLGGHQIIVDIQDNSFNKEWVKDLRHPEDPDKKSRLLDSDRYLNFVEGLGLNYVRSWIIWSTGSGKSAPPHKVAFPMPFKRAGPEKANDGEPKFDLRQFDEVFFQRLQDRCQDLQNRGVISRSCFLNSMASWTARR